MSPCRVSLAAGTLALGLSLGQAWITVTPGGRVRPSSTSTSSTACKGKSGGTAAVRGKGWMDEAARGRILREEGQCLPGFAGMRRRRRTRLEMARGVVTKGGGKKPQGASQGRERKGRHDDDGDDDEDEAVIPAPTTLEGAEGFWGDEDLEGGDGEYTFDGEDEYEDYEDGEGMEGDDEDDDEGGGGRSGKGGKGRRGTKASVAAAEAAREAALPSFNDDESLQYEYVDLRAEMEAWEDEPAPAIGDVPTDEMADPARSSPVKDFKSLGPPKPVRGIRPMDRRKYPVVAVIGRPNVGKSAIVNRLARRFQDGSIVFDQPGVTRDRTYKRAYHNEYEFDIVDTGGLVFEDDPDEVFADEIRQQAMIALEEASAAILVVDGQGGLNVLDEQIARFLRQQKVPVHLAVNKCESETVGDLQAADFWSLGLGEPWPVSGLHGYGLADLMDEIMPDLYQVESPEGMEEDTVNVAIVGRPNVGKSSLLNQLYGEERAIVSDVSGTTRDTIDALFERGTRSYRLIDTAGIRRKKKIVYGNEFFMINRAFKAIRRADVVLLMIDVEDGIKDQDRILAERIRDEGRACIVVCNKWDAVEKTESTYPKAVKYVRSILWPTHWADIVFISAKTGQRTQRIFDMVDEAVAQHRRRIKTSVLNECLRDAVLWQAPPTRKGAHAGKVYYCNQVASRPPSIAIFCNNPKLFSDNYRRYLERKFREQIGFKSTPVRFLWRGKRLRRLGKGEAPPKPYARLG